MQATQFYSQWLGTPVGDLVAIADDKAVLVLAFGDRMSTRDSSAALSARMRAPVAAEGNTVTASIAREIEDYFAGRAGEFHTPLAPVGSDFEQAVWAELLKVPLAETCSYGDIARKVGGLEASRAVGKANNANPIVIAIPCHRCIGADGALTGYGGGLWRKRWLLRHEGQMRPIGLFAVP